MKEATPYILFAAAQTIAFVVWIVKMNIDFNKKIGIMEQQIKELEKDTDSVKKEQKEIGAKLGVVSELLAVCKNTIDLVSLKFMKTRST